MYCSNCGKEITNGLKFCPNCGEYITNENIIGTTTKKKSGSKKKLVIGIGTVVAVAVVAIGGTATVKNSATNENASKVKSYFAEYLRDELDSQNVEVDGEGVDTSEYTFGIADVTNDKIPDLLIIFEDSGDETLYHICGYSESGTINSYDELDESQKVYCFCIRCDTFKLYPESSLIYYSYNTREDEKQEVYYLYNPDEEGIRLATYNSGSAYIDKNRNGETGDDEYEEGEYDLSLDEFYDYVDSLNLDDQEVINVEDIEFHDLTIKNIRDYLEK